MQSPAPSAAGSEGAERPAGGPACAFRAAVPAVLGAFVLSRVVLTALGCVVALIRRQSPLSVWNQWDSRWYLGIAQHGYHWGIHGKPALAFFPLYPLLVHLGAGTGLSAAPVALLISNGAFAAALFYLYLITEIEWGRDAAGRAVWLVALFPTAFFTFAPYSESLFLLCAGGGLYHAMRGHRGRSGLWVAGALLTRSTGVIVLPVLLMALQRRRFRSWIVGVVVGVGPCLAAAGAYILYLGSQHLTLDRLVNSQRAWHRALTYPWTGFTSSLSWLERAGAAQLPWAVENMLQLGVTLGFLLLTAAAWKHLGRATALYCAGFWLLVLSSPEWLDRYYAPFSSMDRFVLALFPLAGWAATHLAAARFRLLLTACGILMVGSATVHLAGGWVG